MNEVDNPTPDLAQLLRQRLAIVSALADSLEASRAAFRHNDAEAIARGAAHQAELCHQWSLLEEQLRAQAARRRILPVPPTSGDPGAGDPSATLDAEWQALAARIRYLTRVHASLLRHMQRSLSILDRLATSLAPTYAPAGDAWQSGHNRLRAGG
jgi:hypothetical protein